MKKGKFLVASFVVMLLFIASFVVNPVAVNAGDKGDENCFIVSLKGNISSEQTAAGEKIITIAPQYLEVPVGSCVVWVNWVRGAEISTSFKEGKVCAVSTKSPVGFRLTPNMGCFVTDFLAQGETTSLRFMEPGTYKYDIYTQNMVAPLASGKIIVK
ncbi:MAG: hypothetical protein KKC46_19265 [Proteobacteria bacterium]|nr:hypothetical protein [Pseudomonadota bacterium]